MFSGLEHVDGKYVHDNETVYRNWLFAPDQEAIIICTVRKDGISCTFNAKTIVDWRGDPKRLSLPPGYTVPDRKALFLATRGSRYAIRGVTVFPYTPANLLVGIPKVPEAVLDVPGAGNHQLTVENRLTLPAISSGAQTCRKGRCRIPAVAAAPLAEGKGNTDSR